jgi:hypothetical protein
VTIGVTQDVDGIEFLRIGTGLARAFHGACAICGEEFHRSIGDRALALLVQHVLLLRSASGE